MKLELIESTRTETMATDGRGIYYNVEWVLRQSDAELVAVIAHEVMHCLMQHHTRRGTRDPEGWNVAADHVINLPLTESGFTLPPGALLDQKYRGMSAEQAFALDRQQRQEEKQQQQEQEQEQEQDQDDASDDGEPGEDESPENNVGDDESETAGEQEGQEGEPGEGEGEDAAEGGEGEGEAQPGAGEGSDTEGESEGGGEGESSSTNVGNDGEPREPAVAGEVWDAPDPAQDEAEWQVTAQQAAMAAQKFGTLPGFAAQMVKAVNKPRTDWRSVLRRFVQQTAAADYSMKMPNRRYLASGVYLPSLREPACGPIAVYLDTSGSTMGFQSAFLAEVQSIADEVLPEKVILIEWDTRMNRATEFERGDEIKTPDNQLRGMGGTDFREAFDWLDKEGIEPACIVFLTDGEAMYPELPPAYPIMWALTPPSRYWRQEGERVPWGESVELELDV
jgi:predicted metal-dependent peptidase